MPGSMPRLLALALLAALAVASPAAAKPVVGLSDQTPTPFTSPLFAPLGMTTARYIAPWNVALGGDSTKFDAWLAAARGAHVTPLVGFEHATGDLCPDQPCTLPSDAQYEAAFAAFRARYPDITTISPWNEANHKTQPTYKDPLQAASYYDIVKRLCVGCKIVAADVLDEPNMVRWLTRFKEGEPHARLWGLHNYGDTNRFRTTGTSRMLATVPGTIWLTETGAIVSFTTSKGVHALPASESRAARSMRYLFTKLVPSSRRIKRVYIYNWSQDPNNRFDAGLVRADGSTRATYSIVKKYTSG